MESKFVTATILVRPHQVSNLYQYAAQLLDDEDMAFPPLSPNETTVTASSVTVSEIPILVPVPSTPPKDSSTTDAPPDGPPQSVQGTVDPTKFSGCRNVNEVVGILWKENGIRTVADARKAFDQIRTSGECAAAKVVPEDGIDTRITRAIELLKSG